MAHKLVDTNVLIVASAAAGHGAQYPDVPVGPKDIERVVNWLVGFRDDPGRKMVIDELFRIYDEYRNKLTDQHLGLQVIHHKLADCLVVPVEYDEHGYGKVPPAFDQMDRSDKKFVAAALHDPANTRIVNACDSDWEEQKELLRQHGIDVLELLR